MSVLRTLFSNVSALFREVSPLQPRHYLIEDAGYLNDPAATVTMDPLISSPEFEELVDMLGLEAFGAYMKPGVAFTFPEDRLAVKPNGHRDLQLQVILSDKGPVALFSLIGPSTELHVVIKKQAETDLFHIDHIHVMDFEKNHAIACDREHGDENILLRLAGCFYLGVYTLVHPEGHDEKDRELLLARTLNQVLRDMEDRQAGRSFAPAPNGP